MEQIIKVSEPIENFLRVVEAEHKKKQTQKSQRVADNPEEIEQIAFWYEKVRMAIDYREDHLLRRTASRRILKRLLIFEGRKKDIADILLKELIMGGYVKKNDLNEEKFLKINKTLNKYIYAILFAHQETTFGSKNRLEIKRWLVTVASFEIEEILYPLLERRALIDAVYKLLSPRIDTDGYDIPNKQKNLQTYIAVYRSLAKADRAMVTSEVFQIYFPDWFEDPSSQRIEEIIKDSPRIIQAVKSQATSILASRIFYAIKKETLNAYMLYEITMDNPRDVRNIISQEYLLDEFISNKVGEETNRVRGKLRQRIKRGLIYIVLTKMFLAVILEIPWEKYFEGGVNYLTLGINILFPPIFMIFLATSARFPGEENTKAIIKGVKNFIFDDPAKDEVEKINVYPPVYSKFSEKTLNFIYFVVFSFVFGSLVWFLYFFNFNFLSGIIFFIFMATVSFFGALIRQPIRDLTVTKEKEGLGSLLFDTLLLPFVRFGRWISTNFSRVNVFMFLLDVLIEAPFKIIMRLFESWINFLKKKREEVDQQFG
jgi:hypothetical protein